MIETNPEGIPRDLSTDEEKEIRALVRHYADIPEPVPEKDNPDALFEGGWGRRRSIAVLVASSGVGKSVISTQLFVPWALGKQALIGSAPLHPLRVSFIQAEDDDTEMGEFRRDHRKGYADEGWEEAEVRRGEELVADFSRVFEGLTDDDFIRKLDKVLDMFPQDVVVLNPFQSYTAFDLNDNNDLKAFVNAGLLGLMKRHRAFMLIVHHTNKPNINNITKGGGWSADDLASYAGAGGASLTNTARSVTFIRRCTPKECPIENSFYLIGAKRGNRLGWKDADGKKTNKKIIAYSEDYIHWRVPTPEEIAEAATQNQPLHGRGSGLPEAPSVPPATPSEAASLIADIIRANWPKSQINNYCRKKLSGKIPRGNFKAAWEHFTLNHKSYGLKIVPDGNNSYHFENDPDFRPVSADSSADSPDDDLFDNDSQPTYR